MTVDTSAAETHAPDANLPDTNISSAGAPDENASKADAPAGNAPAGDASQARASDAGGGSSQIIKNVLMNWMAYAATIVVGFFLSPFLVRHLGDSVYGVWVLVGSLSGYLGLLDLGLTPATVKTIAAYRARGDQAAINRLVTGGLAVFSVLGVIVLGLSCVLALSFNRLFHAPLDATTTTAVVMLAGLNLAITFPATIFIGVLRGYQRYDLDAAVTSLTILLRSALLVALILRGHGILTLSVLTFVFDMARLAYLVYCARRINPDIRIARTHFHWPEMRQLFGHSSYFFLITIGNQLNFFTDSIVIGLFLTTASVTVYFIANRLVTYLRDLVVEMTGVLMPAISGLHASEQTARVHELHIVSTKYTMLLALPAAAVFFILGDSFIRLWMGDHYGQSVLILHVLTVAILANLILQPTASVLTGMGQHRVVAQFTIVQAVANLLLSLVLVPTMGLLGVALGTAISMVALTLAALPVYFRRYLTPPLGGYLRRSMLPPLLAQAPFVAALLALRNYAPPTTLLMFFGVVCAALLPYGVIAFITCTGPPERRAFRRFAEKLGFKPAPRFS